MTASLRLAIGGIYAALVTASTITAIVRRLRPGADLAELRARVRTWWVMAVAFTAVVAVQPRLSVLFFALASALAIREFLIVTSMAGAAPAAYALIAAHYGLVAAGRLELLAPLAAATALAVPATLALGGRTAGFTAAAGTLLLGAGLTVFGLGHAAYLVALPAAAGAPAGAAGLLVYLVVLTQANDVAQYLCGKAIGRRRVAPHVSPAKTVAGLAGGVAAAALLGAAAAPLLTAFEPAAGLVAGTALGLAGFLGDLTMSAVKRDAGVKDSGTLLPGHGGALDRLDSLIFTAPLFFHLVRVLG